MIKTGFLLDNVAVPSHYYELKKKGVIRLNSWQLQLKGKRINEFAGLSLDPRNLLLPELP